MGGEISKIERVDAVRLIGYILNDIEVFLKGIGSRRPTGAEKARFRRLEAEFRSHYRILVYGSATNQIAEDLLTRFSKLHNTWNKMELPESYRYTYPD